jgi:predicted RNase H-like nuclease (RuvC/YqgF family)
MLVATRRKKGQGDGSEITRGFSVVVEEMRGHFKVFGEQLSLLGEKVTRLDDRVTRLDDRVTRLDDRVARLDERVTTLDERVTKLDERMGLRFERVEHKIGLLEVAVLEVGHELRKKVDRDEVEAIVEGVLARKARR